MADINQQQWDNVNLFASVSEPPWEETIIFSGEIPNWLKGTLYRNGPGANEINNDMSTTVNHLFDGLAFIQKYAIDGSSRTVRFRASFIKSHTYKDAIKHGRLVTRQFATDPCKSIFGRFQVIFSNKDASTLTDDTNITVQKVNNELLALTETIIGNILDPETLDTLGSVATLPFTTPMDSEILTTMTAHIMRDEKRKMTVGYAIRITSRNHWLDVFFIPDETTDQVITNQSELDDDKIICVNDRFLLFTSEMSERCKRFNQWIKSNTRSFRYPLEQASYMHSASITENFLVLCEIPLHFSKFNAIRTLINGKAFTDMFEWNGTKKTSIFRIINLDTGDQVAQIAGPAFFNFHHINAYESTINGSNTIIVDICCYDDHRIIDEFYLKNLRKNIFPSGAGFLRRFHLNLKTNKCTEPYSRIRLPQGAHPISYSNSLVPVQFELPRINPHYNGRPYRFVYVVRAPPGCIFDALIKIDIESNVQSAIWKEPCTSPGEPVFVPKPHTDGEQFSEDDGVVLSVVLEQKVKRSFLLVLDGKTFKELGRAYLSIHIPLSFHGNFY